MKFGLIVFRITVPDDLQFIVNAIQGAILNGRRCIECRHGISDLDDLCLCREGTGNKFGDGVSARPHHRKNDCCRLSRTGRRLNIERNRMFKKNKNTE